MEQILINYPSCCDAFACLNTTIILHFREDRSQGLCAGQVYEELFSTGLWLVGNSVVLTLSGAYFSFTHS